MLACEEERRKRRRDLHDGLGPQLASQTLTLDVIARLLYQDPEQAATLLQAVREQVQQAVSDIRNDSALDSRRLAPDLSLLVDHGDDTTTFLARLDWLLSN